MADSLVDRVNLMQQYDLEGPVRFVTLSDTSLTYSIKVSDRCIHIDTTSVTGDGVAIATLPSLAEAAGLMFYVVAPAGATGGDLSLYEKETGAEYSGGDMDADDDHLILFSDGVRWRTVLNGVA